jgi:hypothetical protein
MNRDLAESYEVAAGFHPNTRQIIKLSYEIQHNDQSGQTNRAVMVQLVTTIHPLSLPAGPHDQSDSHGEASLTQCISLVASTLSWRVQLVQPLDRLFGLPEILIHARQSLNCGFNVEKTRRGYLTPVVEHPLRAEQEKRRRFIQPPLPGDAGAQQAGGVETAPGFRS